jgi:predicted RNase H-like HicB family nuclease
MLCVLLGAKRLHHRAAFCPDNNGSFVAYLPAIASCHAWEQTIEKAQAELVHVFELI